MHKLGLIGHWDDVLLFSVVMVGRCFKVSAELSVARVPATISKLAVVYWLSHTLLLEAITAQKFLRKKKHNLTVCASMEVLIVNGSNKFLVKANILSLTKVIVPTLYSVCYFAPVSH